MRFEYLEPTTMEEAVSLLTKYDGKAKVIAGGTDLIVQMRKRQIRPQYMINLGFITDLDYINYSEKEGLKIGALTTIRALEKSTELKQQYPVISQAAGQLASVAIRNVATVGGNLCNAAPSADMAPALIGLSATVEIVGPAGERVVLLEDFFTGPGNTVLKTGELLKEIQVPVLSPRTGATYLKHGIRGSIDLAIVGVAAVIRLEPRGEACQDIKVVLGAVAPTPMRARNAEEFLKGKVITQAEIDGAGRLASEECRPIPDVRASAEYRRQMVNVFTKRAISEAVAAAKTLE